MYVVKTTDGEVVAICSREEDAKTYTMTKIDKVQYVVEEWKPNVYK